jgi:tRNA modification GTPase
VQALHKTCERLKDAQASLSRQDGPELVAEDCLLAHKTLGEIVGTLTPDDLLGEIFSTFCIGK